MEIPENVTFFIAKDELEFRKYKRGADTFSTCSVIHISTGQEMDEDGAYVEKGIPMLYGECLYNKDGSIIVFHFKDAMLKNAARDILKSSDENDKKKQLKEFFNALQYCLEVISEKNEPLSSSLESGLIFIHWGDGEPLIFEQQFREFIEKHTDIYTSFFKDVRAYAISSRRKEYFDITVPKIELPKNDVEIQRLEMRFSFDLFKEQISEYVTETQIQKNNNTDCNWKMEQFALDKLHAYLKEKRIDWSKMYFSREEKQRRRNLIDKAIGGENAEVGIVPTNVDANANATLKLDVAVAELFSIILQEDAPRG